MVCKALAGDHPSSPCYHPGLNTAKRGPLPRRTMPEGLMQCLCTEVSEWIFRCLRACGAQHVQVPHVQLEDRAGLELPAELGVG